MKWIDRGAEVVRQWTGRPGELRWSGSGQAGGAEVVRQWTGRPGELRWSGSGQAGRGS